MYAFWQSHVFDIAPIFLSHVSLCVIADRPTLFGIS